MCVRAFLVYPPEHAVYGLHVLILRIKLFILVLRHTSSKYHKHTPTQIILRKPQKPKQPTKHPQKYLSVLTTTEQLNPRQHTWNHQNAKDSFLGNSKERRKKLRKKQTLDWKVNSKLVQVCLRLRSH